MDLKMALLCGGCSPNVPCPDCLHAFGRIGIRKVHWECWSECNLTCSFCYRMRGQPLDTNDGYKLIQIVKTSGANSIVFAGGDPSLRTDINDLAQYASNVGLKVEVQTNAHFQPQRLLNVLTQADLVGLSLDAHTPERHDQFRGKGGNFVKVVKLLQFLCENKKPVIVRSVVSAKTYDSIPYLAPLLLKYDNIVKWSLLEFTPIGEGYINQLEHSLEQAEYHTTVSKVLEAVNGELEIDAYFGQKKLGTYALITPDGLLYGTSKTNDGDYPKVGSILNDHLSDLAKCLFFSKENHAQRYSR